MKHLFLPLVLFSCLAGSSLSAQETVNLQPSTPAVKSALSQVVTQQLSAFAAGDFDKAFTFASSGIQKLFTPPVFEKMVRANYPIMLTSPKVNIGVALDDGQQGVAFVEMNAVDGPVEYFRYLLTREAGGWKINGVEQVEKAKSTRPPLSA